MATYQYIVTMKKTILFAVVVLQVFFAAAQNNENYKIFESNRQIYKIWTAIANRSLYSQAYYL